MYEYTLKEVFEELHKREFAEFDKPPRHIFSLRHRRAMKKILSVNQPERHGLRCLPPTKRTALIVLLIFMAILTATACTVVIDILKKAPEKWVTEAGYSFKTVKVVGEFMRNELGIDLNATQSTHSLTPEQREWLYSRHDFDTMQIYAPCTFVNDGGQTHMYMLETPEYNNFIADLAYLGVYNADELTTPVVEVIDIKSGNVPTVFETANKVWDAAINGDLLDASPTEGFKAENGKLVWYRGDFLLVIGDLPKE